MPIKVPAVVTGLEASVQRSINNVNRRGPYNLKLNEKSFSRPLGKITGQVSEFNKSLEASNARVLAFGASVGIIQGVQKAFSSLIKTTVMVEKSMAEINVVMGVSQKELGVFADGLYKVARNTAQSFSTVAVAATELARQGLTMQETLKRANDALVLTRLTGLDAASAVKGLTAAINTFNQAGLDSTKIISKMAAVDVQFAVSTQDLIDGISRAGAVANDAGVSFDQLMGAVTAAQQATARGGKVIGNSFKTIFTRVQRQSTLKALEALGIAVQDVAGNTLPAITVLSNLAKTYDTLADRTKAAVAEQVGGVFQINILKAAIKDLANENSVLARATKTSAMATDEAYKKNELLNKTIAALTMQTTTAISELAAVIGDLALSDHIRDWLNTVKSGSDLLSGILSDKEGEGQGSEFAKGMVKGIGNVLAGPGMIAFLAVFTKLFAKTMGFLGGSVKEMLGITSAASKQKAVQASILAILAENSSLQQRLMAQEGNRAGQQRVMLTILQAQTREHQRQAALAASLSRGIVRAGYGPSLQPGKSEGHIPNYASSTEKKMEKSGARKAGYSPGAVKTMRMPGEGRVVYNSAEKIKHFPGLDQPAIMPPRASRAGRNYKKSFGKVHGFNPYANAGFVPNYNAPPLHIPRKGFRNITPEELGKGRHGLQGHYGQNEPLKMVFRGIGKPEGGVSAGGSKSYNTGWTWILDNKKIQKRHEKSVDYQRLEYHRGAIGETATNKVAGRILSDEVLGFIRHYSREPRQYGGSSRGLQIQNVGRYGKEGTYEDMRGNARKAKTHSQSTQILSKDYVAKLVKSHPEALPEELLTMFRAGSFRSNFSSKELKELGSSRSFADRQARRGKGIGKHAGGATWMTANMSTALQFANIGLEKKVGGAHLWRFGNKGFVPNKVKGKAREYSPSSTLATLAKYETQFNEAHGIPHRQTAIAVRGGKLNKRQAASQNYLLDFILKRAKIPLPARESAPFPSKMGSVHEISKGTKGNWIFDKLDSIKSGKNYRAAVMTGSGKTFVSRWHDSLRDAISHPSYKKQFGKKEDLSQARDLMLEWRNEGFIPNYGRAGRNPKKDLEELKALGSAGKKLYGGQAGARSIDEAAGSSDPRLMSKLDGPVQGTISAAELKFLMGKGFYTGVKYELLKDPGKIAYYAAARHGVNVHKKGDSKKPETWTPPPAGARSWRAHDEATDSMVMHVGSRARQKNPDTGEHLAGPELFTRLHLPNIQRISAKNHLFDVDTGKTRGRVYNEEKRKWEDEPYLLEQLGLVKPYMGSKQTTPAVSPSAQIEQYWKRYTDTGYSTPKTPQAKGHVPNYALSSTPLSFKDYMSGFHKLNPFAQTAQKDDFFDKIERRGQKMQYRGSTQSLTPSEYFEETPKRNLEAMKYLDNKALEKIKTAIVNDTGMVKMFSLVSEKGAAGRVTAADPIKGAYLSGFESSKQSSLMDSSKQAELVRQELKRTSAREVFNYLLGNSERIQGRNPGQHIKLLDHSSGERKFNATEILGQDPKITKIIGDEIGSMKKHPTRQWQALNERLFSDSPGLGNQALKEFPRTSLAQGRQLASLYGSINTMQADGALSPPIAKFLHKNLESLAMQSLLGGGPSRLQVTSMDALIPFLGDRVKEPYAAAGVLRGKEAAKLGLEQFPAKLSGMAMVEDAERTRKSTLFRMTQERNQKARREKNLQIISAGAIARLEHLTGIALEFEQAKGIKDPRSGIGFAGDIGVEQKLLKKQHLDNITKSIIDFGNRATKEPPDIGQLVKSLQNQAYKDIEKFQGEKEFKARQQKDQADTAQRQAAFNRKYGRFMGRKGLSEGFIPNFARWGSPAPAPAGLRVKPGYRAEHTHMGTRVRKIPTRRRKQLSADEQNEINMKNFRLDSKLGALPPWAVRRPYDPMQLFTLPTKELLKLKRKHSDWRELDYELAQRKTPFMRSYYSGGHVPNYGLLGPGASNVIRSSPSSMFSVMDAIKRESSHGVTPVVVKAPQLKSTTNPGLAVVNKEQEGGKLSIAKKLHGRLNPKQGSSGGFVPNFVSITPDIAVKITEANKSLTSVGNIANQVASNFTKLGTATKAQLAVFKQLQSATQAAAIGARDWAVKQKMEQFAGRPVSKGGYGFTGDRFDPHTQAGHARHMFRSEEAKKLAASGGKFEGLMKSAMVGGKFDQGRWDSIRQAAHEAKSAGGAEAREANATLKAMNAADRKMNMHADRRFDPKAMGTVIAHGISKDLNANLRNAKAAEKIKNRIMGTGGYNRGLAESRMAAGFLAKQGVAQEAIAKMDPKQITAAALGTKATTKAFTQYMRKEGVMDSRKSLARGGIQYGQLHDKGMDQQAQRRLSATMDKLREEVKKGGKAKFGNRFAIMAARNAAMAQAATAPAAFPMLRTAIQTLEDDQKKRNKKKGRKGERKAQRERGTNALSGGNKYRAFGLNFGLGANQNRASRFANRIASGYHFGRAGDGGAGMGLGGRFGAGVGGAWEKSKAGMKKFGGGITGGLGGMGMTLAFALPMMAGFIKSEKSRESRAEFVKNESGGGSFEIQEDAWKEKAPSVLMGAGMGAIFGLPGLIIGSSLGWIAAQKKTTLSLEELASMNQKGMQDLSRSIQAGSKISGLLSQREAAINKGDTSGITKANAGINQMLANITDPGHLRKLARAAGSAEDMDKAVGDMSDELARDQAVVNFTSAMGRAGSGKNAGTALGSMVWQKLEAATPTDRTRMEGDIDSSLERIRQKTAARRDAIDPTNLKNLRSASQGGIDSGSIVKGIAAGIVAAAAIMFAAPTGGLSLGALGVVGTGAAATIGGATAGTATTMVAANNRQARAQQDLLNMQGEGHEQFDFLIEMERAGVISKDEYERMLASVDRGSKTMGEMADDMEDALDSFKLMKKRSKVLGKIVFQLDREMASILRDFSKKIAITQIRAKSDMEAKVGSIKFASQFQGGVSGRAAYAGAPHFVSQSGPFRGTLQPRSGFEMAKANIKDMFKVEMDMQAAGEFVRDSEEKKKMTTFFRKGWEGLKDPVREGLTAKYKPQSMNIEDFAKEIDDQILTIPKEFISNEVFETQQAREDQFDDLLDATKKALGPAANWDELERITGHTGQDVQWAKGLQVELQNTRGTGRRPGGTRWTDFLGGKAIEAKGALEMPVTITKQQREAGEDLVEAQRTLRDIMYEERTARVRAVKIQYVQNAINAKLNDNLTSMMLNAKKKTLEDKLSFVKEKGKSDRAVDVLSFRGQNKSGASLRGTTEAKRQEEIQDEINKEQIKMLEMQKIMQSKSDIMRLLSDKKVIFALDNLSEQIKDVMAPLVKEITGVDVTAITGGMHPVTTGGASSGLGSVTDPGARAQLSASGITKKARLKEKLEKLEVPWRQAKAEIEAAKARKDQHTSALVGFGEAAVEARGNMDLKGRRIARGRDTREPGAGRGGVMEYLQWQPGWQDNDGQGGGNPRFGPRVPGFNMIKGNKGYNEKEALGIFREWKKWQKKSGVEEDPMLSELSDKAIAQFFLRPIDQSTPTKYSQEKYQLGYQLEKSSKLHSDPTSFPFDIAISAGEKDPNYKTIPYGSVRPKEGYTASISGQTVSPTGFLDFLPFKDTEADNIVKYHETLREKLQAWYDAAVKYAKMRAEYNDKIAKEDANITEAEGKEQVALTKLKPVRAKMKKLIEGKMAAQLYNAPQGTKTIEDTVNELLSTVDVNNNFDPVNTRKLITQITDIAANRPGGLEEITEFIKTKTGNLKAQGPDSDIAKQFEILALLLERNAEEITQEVNNQKTQKALTAFRNSMNALQSSRFHDSIEETVAQMEKLRLSWPKGSSGRIAPVDPAEDMASRMVMERMVETDAAVLQRDVTWANPLSTDLEKAQSRTAAGFRTLGEKRIDSRTGKVNISEMSEERRRELMERVMELRQDSAERLDKARVLDAYGKPTGAPVMTPELVEALKRNKDAITELTDSMVSISPRGKGFMSDFTTGMGFGLDEGFAQVKNDAETIYLRLGKEVPMAFRDGIAGAMMMAINKVEDMGDKMRQIGIEFLQMIQSAFLQSAASRVVDFIGGVGGIGGASGGQVFGGSGVRDDVPAMLMGGEYVIRKSAVEKYGTSFLDQVNTGGIGGYARGGVVSHSVKSPRAEIRAEYDDKSPYGDITKYKVTKGERGIDPSMSSYARANDRKIQDFFGEQGDHIAQDASIKEQLEERVKEQGRQKTARRRALQGMLISVVGAAALSGALKWAKGKNYGIKRREERAFNHTRDVRAYQNKVKKSLAKDGAHEFTGGKGFGHYPQGSPEVKDIREYMKTEQFTRRSAQEQSSDLATRGWNHKVFDNTRFGGPNLPVHGSPWGTPDYNPTTIELIRQKGGKVPSLLTGGEYVMSPEAVQRHGPSKMAAINGGSLPAVDYSGQKGSSGDVTNAINITVNVASGGTTQTSDGGGANQNPKQFANQIKSAVLQVINEQKRVGGSLR